ncbi:MAG: glucokinase [Pseudomonadota bacterium]
MPLLAGDIGGTKTLLGLQSAHGALEQVREYRNQAHDGVDAILHDFLQQTGTRPDDGLHLVLAIAGPVDQARCQMTNLPWLIDSATLQQQFRFKSVHLLNDLEATGWAMPGLGAAGLLLPLRGDHIDFGRPVAVMSIGTGLGQAALIPQNGGTLQVLSSEGGHKQFAPFDARSASLLQQAYATGHTGVSWENWFSGSGLPRLFQALFPDMEAPDSQTITELAVAQPGSCEAQCVHLLMQGLMAEAGNLALQYAAWGGVIFAGGVAQHLLPYWHDPDLQRWLEHKTDHVQRLRQVPLAMCTDTQAALRGAADYFWHQQMRGN